MVRDDSVDHERILDVWGDPLTSGLDMVRDSNIRGDIFVAEEAFSHLRSCYVFSRGSTHDPEGAPMFRSYVLEGRAPPDSYGQYFESMSFP